MRGVAGRRRSGSGALCVMGVCSGRERSIARYKTRGLIDVCLGYEKIWEKEGGEKREEKDSTGATVTVKAIVVEGERHVLP